jgi:hypothetical protein
MKLTKLVSYFSVFSMIFWRILQDLCFYKEKNERKGKKTCKGLVQPTTKPTQLQGFSPCWKRSPPGETHSDLDILHQEPRSISKTIKALLPFLSLWHLYIWNPVFLSILFPTSNLGIVNLTVNRRWNWAGVGQGWTKKEARNFAFLVLGIDLKTVCGLWILFERGCNFL